MQVLGDEFTQSIEYSQLVRLFSVQYNNHDIGRPDENMMKMLDPFTLQKSECIIEVLYYLLSSSEWLQTSVWF